MIKSLKGLPLNPIYYPKLCVTLPEFIEGWLLTADHKPEKTPSPSPSPPF
jgi:hypothetical protein